MLTKEIATPIVNPTAINVSFSQETYFKKKKDNKIIC